MIKVLGFSGKARHGKDFCAAVAQEVAKESGFNMGRIALADVLKARVYGEAGGRYSLEQVFVNKPPQVRDTLQQVGTERGRWVFGENFWTLQVEAMLYVFEKSMPFLDAVVIPDIRFPNEVEFVKLGGTAPVNLSRVISRGPGLQLHIKSDRPTLMGEFAQHASETSLDGVPDDFFDGIIFNNLDTTRDELKKQIRPYVQMLFGV